MTTDEQERPEDAARKFAHRLIRIEELHQPKIVCKECEKDWPCTTSQWLDESNLDELMNKMLGEL